MKDKVVFVSTGNFMSLTSASSTRSCHGSAARRSSGQVSAAKTMSYSFSHLDPRVACCLLHCKNGRVSRGVFQTLLDKPRFAAVLQFYAGFTKLANQGVQKIIMEQISLTSGLPSILCLVT